MTHRAHHLEIDASQMAGNGDLGRYVFLPGSPDRAERLATRFVDVEVHRNRRCLDVYMGRIERDGRWIDVAAVPTGMGSPSIDIVVSELLQLGARRFLRSGTSGALQPTLKLGDLVIATAAVRDEGASDVYAPREFPAVADPLLVQMLCEAAEGKGVAERVHCGIIHSKDSLFGREFATGPAADINRAYMELLSRAGVMASEMEAAHLFVLGSVFGHSPPPLSQARTSATKVRCGAVLAVIGDESGFAKLDDEQSAEERLIDVAVEGICRLAMIEMGRR